MSPLVEVQDLVKVYGGDIRAVDGISFTVEPGEVFGFLGPNGAGKTTAIRVLVTRLLPTSGTAKVAHSLATKISAAPEIPMPPPNTNP